MAAALASRLALRITTMRPALLPALLAAFALSGCAATPRPADDAVVEGRATFYEKLLMPPGSVLAVELVDIARGNAVLAREEFASPSGPPYAFAMRYAAADVPEGAELGVRAALSTPDGERMFATAGPVPVMAGRTQPFEFRMLRTQ